MINAQCPCKKTTCKRHGDCEACKEFHKYPPGKPSTACERIRARDEEAARKAGQNGDTLRTDGDAIA